MSGGGGSKGGGGGYQAPVQPYIPDVEPVPTANIRAAQGPAFGLTATPNPYVAGNQPAWATGAFSMPWWGLDPFGQPLTQGQMGYQAAQAQEQQAQPGTDLERFKEQYKEQFKDRLELLEQRRQREQLEQLQYQDWLNGRAAMQAQIQADANNYDSQASSPWANWGQQTSLYGTQYDPRSAWEHKPESQWSLYDRQQAEQTQARRRAAGFKF